MLFLVQKTKLHRQQKIPDGKKKQIIIISETTSFSQPHSQNKPHGKASNHSLQITREVALFHRFIPFNNQNHIKVTFGNVVAFLKNLKFFFY
jgi:hypothetical protein